MPEVDLTRPNAHASELILDLVAQMQPCTAADVQRALAQRHYVEAPLDQVTYYMEWLRSGFPRKLAHAGPERWVVVEL